MGFGPLRFVHACNVRLDQPLSAVGPVSGEVRTVVEDATLTAFQRVVSTCIEKNVDFLLLTGNTFHANDYSLRTEVALREGCRRLAEDDIPVFVVPGEDDPASAWRSGPVWPENVTVFLEADEEPLAVFRDGAVIATLSAVTGDGRVEEFATRPGSTNGPRIGDEPFSIGLLSTARDMEFDAAVSAAVQMGDEAPLAESPGIHFDYLALGGKQARHTHAHVDGIAHHPGTTQATLADETGPCGCTFVEVTPDRRVRTTFVPTAPVRRESIAIDVDPTMHRDELIELMQSALNERRPEPAEQVWLVAWTCSHPHEMFETDSGIENVLTIADVEAAHVTLIHAFHVRRQMRDIAASPQDDTADAWDHEPAREFRKALCHRLPVTGDQLQQLSAGWFDAQHTDGAAPPSSRLRQRVASLLDEIDPAAVASGAIELGESWFAERDDHAERDVRDHDQ